MATYQRSTGRRIEAPDLRLSVAPGDPARADPSNLEPIGLRGAAGTGRPGRVVGHNGGTPGYEAELNVYPDLGHTVVLLSNQDGVLLPALRRTEILTGAGPAGP